MPGEVSEDTDRPLAFWDAEERICCVEFSPYEWSCSLLAVAVKSRLVVLQIVEQDDGRPNVNLDVKWSWKSTVEAITCISWSRESSLTTAPKCLKLITAAGKSLTSWTTNCAEGTNVKVMGSHEDFINCVAIEPELGEMVASVGDDHTARIWGSKSIKFLLSSPGMSVSWHKEDQGKLLVAEKIGIVRFYSVAARQPIMSINTTSEPLQSADWCMRNALLTGALAGGSWHIWDISVPSQPLRVSASFADSGRHFRFCRSHPHFMAVSSEITKQVRVYHTGSDKAALVINTTVVSGPPSWHNRLPCVAVGADRTVLLWMLPNV